MIKENIYEKLTFILSFLILNNFLFLALEFNELILKINFVVFLSFILFFYINNLSEKIYLKIFFIFFLIICLGTPISEWDPRSTWFFHAKRIFYDHSIFSVLDNYAPFSHNDYPTLAPALAASLAKLVGYWNEVFPKVSFTLMFLPPLLLVSNLYKETNALILLFITAFTVGRFLYNGWVDGLVAVYFGTSALLIYLLFLTDTQIYKKKIYYLISFCFFITLTLIKSEGIALLLILFLTTALITLYEGKLRENFLFLLGLSFSFLPILLWKYFCFSEGIGAHFIFESNFVLNFTSRYMNLDNYKLISYFIFLNEKLIITCIFFLISSWINWNKNLFKFVLISCFFYILILFFVYLSTPVDFNFQLESSAARLVRSLSFLLALFGLHNLTNNNFMRYK